MVNMRCAMEGCRAYALKGDQYCFTHSDSKAIQTKRDKARIKGGYAKSRKEITDVELKSVEDVRKLIDETINLLRHSSGSMVSRCRCIGGLAQIALTCITDGGFEARLNDIEARLDEHNLSD